MQKLFNNQKSKICKKCQRKLRKRNIFNELQKGGCKGGCDESIKM
jgi:uncharacterized protein (DUF169 family)